MTKNENKINLVIVLSVVLIIGIILFIVLANNSKTEFVKAINISEFKEKIDNKESFILVITQEGCSHCQAYLPTLTKIGRDHNITFYEMDEKKWSDEDTKYFKSIANFDGSTPTTFFIENGEEKSTLNRIEGNAQEYKVVDKLKALGYINE